MDVRSVLQERPICAVCGQPLPHSDDVAARCLHLAKVYLPRPDSISAAEAREYGIDVAAAMRIHTDDQQSGFNRLIRAMRRRTAIMQKCGNWHTKFVNCWRD